nr:TetR/AcrR family transcriptional regulator [Nocardioides flavescens]
MLRSRQRLHDAVLELAAAGPVDALSVTQVARAAGVHRSTFYEHATSVDELLRAALSAELDVLRAGLLAHPDRPTGEAMEAVTGGVLEHVARHVEVYRRGLAADAGAGSLHAMLAEHFVGTVRALDAQGRLTWPPPVADAPAALVHDTAARFVAAGTVGAIQAWLADPDPPGAATFVELHRTLVPRWWGAT